MKLIDKIQNTNLAKDSIFVPKKSIIGRIVDTVMPWPGALPYDLTREFNRVGRQYEQVLTGNITDPAEVDDIRNKFNDWFDRAKRAIEQK